MSSGAPSDHDPRSRVGILAIVVATVMDRDSFGALIGPSSLVLVVESKPAGGKGGMCRAAVILGLILLAPVAYLLVTGELTMMEVATRAGFRLRGSRCRHLRRSHRARDGARSVEATAPKRRASDVPASVEE